MPKFIITDEYKAYHMSFSAMDDGRLCLLGGRLINGTGAEPVDRGYVRIRDGKIIETGPLAQYQKHDGELVFDVEGATILPGLIDCHAHLCYYPAFKDILEIEACTAERATIYAALNAERILRAGYTTVRDVGSIAYASARVRDAVTAGLLAGPRILAAGPIIAATAGFTDNLPPHWSGSPGLSTIRNGADEWVAAVREQCRNHVDVIKLGVSGVEIGRSAYTWMTTASLHEVRAATREAQLRGMNVAVHCESYEGAKIALRAGVDTIEHGTRLDEEAVDMLVRSRTVLVPTLCTLYGTLEATEKSTIFPKRLEEMAVNEKLWVESLLLAKERGATIAAGTDIGTRIPHGTNARELEYLVRVGFSAMEAIVCATGSAAAAIGRKGLVGTLEAGCFGDAVIVDGDPLSDITLLQDMSRIRAVFKSGKLVAGTDTEIPHLPRVPTESLSVGSLGESWARFPETV